MLSHPVSDQVTLAWIEDTAQPLVVTDQEGGIVAMNRAFECLFALSGSAVPREPLEDLIIASRFRSAYRAARRQALGGQSPGAGSMSDLVAVHAHRGEFAVNVRVARTKTNPSQLVTWLWDLTEDRTIRARTLQRAALHEREEELAGIGSWDWTPQRDRMLWSDNLFRVYGLRPGEIAPAADYVFSHAHPDDRERIRRVTDELVRTGRRTVLRYRYVWPDGTIRHLLSTVISVAQAEGRSRRIIGTVQDLTDQHQAEREIAARFAVSDALSDWVPGAAGALRLVRDLAEALEFEVATMWVPRDDVLVAWTIWQARDLHAPALEPALRELRLRRAVGLAGSAWLSGEPARATDLTGDAADLVRAVGAQTGLHALLAVPATYGEEVLAVLTFASPHPAVLTDRFLRSLLGISYEIGHFLARRRSELSAPALTPRELQVLQLAATGYGRRQIADKIEISESTVKTHLEHIYRKLGVADRASAVGEALRTGLVR